MRWCQNPSHRGGAKLLVGHQKTGTGAGLQGLGVLLQLAPDLAEDAQLRPLSAHIQLLPAQVLGPGGFVVLHEPNMINASMLKDRDIADLDAALLIRPVHLALVGGPAFVIPAVVPEILRVVPQISFGFVRLPRRPPTLQKTEEVLKQ